MSRKHGKPSLPRLAIAAFLATSCIATSCGTKREAQFRPPEPVPGVVFESPSKKTEAGLDELARKVAQNMIGAKKNRIAVIDFCDLDGRVSLLGKFVSEELITRLFETGQFYVVERSFLYRVLQQQNLTLDPAIDESTAQQLGKMLGVDAIVTGTITDLVDSYRLNARMIGTETGLVFAAASTSILKNRSLRALDAQ